MVPLVGINELIADSFPLIDSDRDELVTQVLEFYLNENHMDTPQNFRPRLEFLHIDMYQLAGSETSSNRLYMLAMDIHLLVRQQLLALGMNEVVKAQNGFFYIFDHFLPNGYYVVLKNIAPP